MQNINVCTVSGHLVRDAEVKTFDSGYSVISFTIATNRSVKTDGNWGEKTSFFDCKYFTKGTKLSSYMTKGTKVLVSGNLEQEVWESDGQKRSRIVIKADEVELMSGNQNNNSAPQQQYQQFPQPAQQQFPQQNAFPNPANPFAQPAQPQGYSEDIPF